MSGKGQEYDTEIVHQQLPEERMKYQQRRSHKGTASRYDTSRSGVAFDLGISHAGLCRTSYQYQFSIHSKAGVAAFGAALAFLYLAPSRGVCSSRLQP